MRTIWKYRIVNLGLNNFDMPVGARILATQAQQGFACLWAEVDPTQNKRKVKIFNAVTGQDVPEEYTHYIGTVQIDNRDFGNLVTHLYIHREHVMFR